MTDNRLTRSENMPMIKNPSFEGIQEPGEWTRDTHDGHQYSEVFTPAGWVTWWEEGEYRRPECKVIPKKPPFVDPPRICDGQWGWQAFTKFGRQNAGLYQKVESLQIGSEYELSAHVHSWSAHPGVGPGEPWKDGHCSSGVGCGLFYMLLADVQKKYPLNGDPVNDAIGNFSFMVGVSFGESDPLGEDVIWSKPACVYNKFHLLPPLKFTATSDTAVVYLRVHSLWQFEVSDAYWDNVILRLISEPTPGVCRGHPRIQYRRTVNIYPKDVTDARYGIICQAARKWGNETVGGSYDDGGIGDLDSRTVRLWDIPIAKHQEYRDWYEKWYPGVVVMFEGIVEDPFAPWRLFALCQRKAQWANVVRAGENCVAPDNTIGADGCWDTMSASAQMILGVRDAATPVTVNDELGPSGFDVHCQVTWEAMKKLNLEIKMTTENYQVVINWLAEGNLAFADTVAGGGKHFWLVCDWSEAESRFIGIDPWDGDVKWLQPNHVDDYRLIQVYEPPLPPSTSVNNIGAHYQQFQHWLPYTRPKPEGADPDYAKLVGGFENCWDIWEQNPRTEVGLRHYTNDYGAVFNAPTPAEGAAVWWSYAGDAVEAIARRLQVEMPGKVIWFEGPNEVYGTFTWEIDKWVQIEVALWELIDGLGLPIGFIPFCGAVGNPHETEFLKLLALALIASRYPDRCRLGYHAYWYANQQESGLVDHWKWLAGRWQEMAEVFAANGAPGVRWLCGEGGAVGGKFIPDPQAFLERALAAAPPNMSLADLATAEVARSDGEFVRFIPRWKSAAPPLSVIAEILLTTASASAAAALDGGYVLLPKDGWKSPECYNGDLDRYLADIVLFEEMLGEDADCTLFTVEGWGWGSFNLGSNEWPRIQTALER